MSLKLDHNHLTGEIPSEIGLLQRIKQFSVSTNAFFFFCYVFSAVAVIAFFISDNVACMNGKQRDRKMAQSKGRSTRKENKEVHQLKHLPT